MSEQVGPVGGLTSGFSVALPSAVLAGPGPGSSTAKFAEQAPQVQVGAATANAPRSPEMAVEQINSHLQQASTQLRMQVDSETGKTIYRVVDPSTGQVVLQVPSAELLAMAHTLHGLEKQAGASGVLVDKKG